MRGHRDVILLVGRGRNRIDAGRIGAGLVLGDQRRRGHLSDHEPGVETGLRCQERWQAGQSRIDQKRDPSFGQRADLANRERDHVGGEGDRLAMKIAARQRFVRFRENERIVRDGVGLGGERRGGLAQEIKAGAHNLRLAAQAVGILDAFIPGQMRSANGAARK